MKPNLFTYWETPEELEEKPGYIQLCQDTIRKYCPIDFEVQEVAKDNIDKYLPQLRDEIWQLNNPAIRADYIRVRLLYEYGGLWLDSDTIVMQRLQDTVKRLSRGYYFIGYRKLSHGDNNSSVNYMAGCKHSPVFERYAEIQDDLLDDLRPLHWSDLGANSLDKALEGTPITKYYLYDEERIQPIPWQEQIRFYQDKEEVEDIIDEDTLTCMVFNNGMKSRSNIPDVRKLSKEKVLEMPILLTKLLKYSLEK